MASSTLRTALGTTVSNAAGDQSRNFEYLTRVGLRAGGLGSTIGYLYFSLAAIPRGAVVSSAKLYLYSDSSAQAGAITLSLKRLRQTVSMTKVTYTTRPTALYGDAARTVTKTGPVAAGTEWMVDVTPHVQSVANGDAWYGWQLTANFNPIAWFNKSNHPNSVQRPRLELTWTVPPTAPTGLRPGGGRAVSLPSPRVAATYTDVGADNALAAVQVQTNATNVWTAPSWDSGVVLTSSPELDLATQGTFVGLASGEMRWWRMRCQDANGLWSAWSLAESFKRDLKGAVTILNPQQSPNNYVTESSPPITWSFTGETQTAYQVNIADPATGRVLYSSGKITGTATALTLPPTALTGAAGTLYNLRVIVWDSKSRETTPGDPAWTDASLDFTFALSASTPPTTNLVLTSGEPRPRVTLTWQRGTFPDSYSIMRNGVVIASGLSPSELAPGGTGTSFTWVDRNPLPQTAATYQALAVVNGQASAGNSTATITLTSLGIWLADNTRANEVVLFGREARSWTYGEESEVLSVLGGSEVSVVTHSQRGLEGTVQGTLQHGSAIGENVTAKAYRDALLRIKRNPGQQCWLTLHDSTIPVVVRAINITPRALPQPVYDVSFEFYEVKKRG
jgi:hypothetical protein